MDRPLSLAEVELAVFPAIDSILASLHKETMDVRYYDKAKLDSALNAPFAGYDGTEAYPGPTRKAAVYLYTVAKAHALPDGNKRTAVVTCLFFLFLNGMWLTDTPVGLYDFTKKIVESKASMKYNVDRIERYLIANTATLETRLKSDGPLYASQS